MKSFHAHVNVNSLAARRIDSAFASRRLVKNALLRVRGWCDKLRRELERNDKIKRENCINESKGKLIVPTMHFDQEEFRNFSNENLENELRELTMKNERRRAE